MIKKIIKYIFCLVFAFCFGSIILSSKELTKVNAESYSFDFYQTTDGNYWTLTLHNDCSIDIKSIMEEKTVSGSKNLSMYLNGHTLTIANSAIPKVSQLNINNGTIIFNENDYLFQNDSCLQVTDVTFKTNCYSLFSVGYSVSVNELDNVTIKNCKFIDCTFSGNKGGAFYFDTYVQAPMTFENNYFYNCESNGALIYINDYGYNTRSSTNHVQFNMSGCKFYNCKNVYSCIYVNSKYIDIGVFNDNGYKNSIANCESSDYGGAIYDGDYGGYGTIKGFVCSNNTSTRKYGGALYLAADSRTVEDCYFIGNSATKDGYGGAIYFEEDDLTIKNSYFLENYAYEGGAIYNNGATNKLTNCYFAYNRAEYGSSNDVYYPRNTTNCHFYNENIDGVFNKNWAYYFNYDDNDENSCSYQNASILLSFQGDGSESNPYQINSEQDIFNLYVSIKYGFNSNLASKRYVITKDNLIWFKTIPSFTGYIDGSNKNIYAQNAIPLTFGGYLNYYTYEKYDSNTRTNTIIAHDMPEEVEYYYFDEELMDFKKRTTSVDYLQGYPTNNTISSGIYYINHNITYPERVEISGNVTLVFNSNVTFKAEKGIRIPNGYTLILATVTTDKNNAGKLVANGYEGNAAIGGNYGGNTIAGSIHGENCGNFFDYGVKLEIISDATGIGGGNAKDETLIIGDDYTGGDGGKVKIYGAVATITSNGTGIGGGNGSKSSLKSGNGGKGGSLSLINSELNITSNSIGIGGGLGYKDAGDKEFWGDDGLGTDLYICGGTTKVYSNYGKAICGYKAGIYNYEEQTFDFVSDTLITRYGLDENHTSAFGSYKIKEYASAKYVEIIDHNHTINYSVNNNTITASCEICGSSVSIAPIISNDFAYDGEGKEVPISNVDNFLQFTGLEEVNIDYYKGQELLLSAPIDVGTYIVKLSVTYDGNKTCTLEKEFSIAKAEGSISISFSQITKTYGELISFPTVESNFGDVVCDTDSKDLVNVGTYIVTYTLDDTDNYSGDTKTLTVVIEQKEVNLNWSTLTENELEYDGLPKELTATATGILDGDKCDVSVALETENDNINVGTFVFKATGLSNENYKLPAVIASPEYTITQSNADNYVKEIDAILYQIESLTLEVTLPDIPSGLSFGTITNENDTLYSVDSTNLNDGKIRLTALQGFETATETSFTILVNGNKNYKDYTITINVIPTEHIHKDFSYDVDDEKIIATCEICGSVVSIAPIISNDFVYDGNEKEVEIFNVDNFLQFTGLEKVNIDYYKEQELLLSAPINAGTYIVKLSVTYDDNKTCSLEKEFSIAKAEGSISTYFSEITKTYGEVVVLPIAESNFGDVVCDTESKDLVNVGTYTVTYTLDDTDNYTGDTKTLTVVIEQKEVNLNWSSLTENELEYDELPKVITATATGILDGDECDVNVALETGNDNINVGTFVFKATGLSNENYKLPAVIISPEYTITQSNADNYVKEINTPLLQKLNSTIVVTLPDIPNELSFGTITNENDTLYSVDSTNLNDGKIKLTALQGFETATETSFTILVNGNKNYKDYTITVNVIPTEHIHGDWNYEVNGDTITATCQSDGCTDPKYTISLTLSAIGGIYDGENTFSASHNDSITMFTTITGSTLGEIKYYNADGQELDLTPINAGTYTAKLTINETEELTLTKAFTITKATYDMSNVKWNYIEPFTYDKEEKSVIIEGLPTGVSIDQYTNNKATNAGEYIASVTFDYDKNNYNEISVPNLTWNINKAQAVIDTTDVVTTYTYTGALQKVENGATLNHCETTLMYSSNTFTNAGTYIITISANETDNYLGDEKTVTIVVNKAQAVIDTTDVVTTYTYTGALQKVENGATLNHSETTLMYSNNTFTNAGTYIITISANETDNYLGDEKTVTIVVNKAQAMIDTTDVVTTYTYTGALQKVENGATLNHSETTLTYSNNTFTNVGTYTITISANETDNYTSDEKTVTVVVNKSQVEKPLEDNTKFEYNGQKQTYKIAESELYTISDNVVQKDIGTYQIEIALKDTTNYEWSDGTTNIIIYKFIIHKGKLSSGAITGISVASLVVVANLVFAIVAIIKKKKGF